MLDFRFWPIAAGPPMSVSGCEADYQSLTSASTLNRTTMSDVQRMSAGSGVLYLEYNASKPRRSTSCSYGSSLTARALAELRAEDVQDTVWHEIRFGRGEWGYVAQGSIKLNGKQLEEGDSVAITQGGTLSLEAASVNTEVLVFAKAA